MPLLSTVFAAMWVDLIQFCVNVATHAISTYRPFLSLFPVELVKHVPADTGTFPGGRSRGKSGPNSAPDRSHVTFLGLEDWEKIEAA